MKKNLLALMLVAASTVPTFAQTSIYQMPKPEFKMTASDVLKAPLGAPESIDDKSKGVTMYVGELNNPSKIRGFVKFKSKDAINLTTLKKYYYNPDDPADGNLGMLCGVYDGKDYYGIFGYSYTYGAYPYHFSKVDMQTGDTTAVYRYTSQEQDAWYNYDFIYAMAYDKAHDEVMALVPYLTTYTDSEGQEQQGYVSALYTIDRKTGKREFVQALDRLYFNFTFDADGNCFMVRPKDNGKGEACGTELVKYNSDFVQESVKELKSEWGESYLMYYYGTMNFDYTTGELYWLPVGAYGATSLYTIDLDKNIFKSVSYFSYSGYSFVGLGIPYLEADSRKAPAQVSGIYAQPNLTGEMSDVVSWTNPTKAWNKTELNDIKDVLIYRKKAGVATTDRTNTATLLSSEISELVATLPADGKEGKKMEWTDSNPYDGINTYYVLATNAAGEKGVLDSVRCFVGEDVPGAVSNIQLKKNGEGVVVSWTAPNKGVNNGYINEDNLKYTLVRMPDNKVVAKDITGTTFDDQTLGEQQKYYYVIQASNTKGVGAKVESDKLMAGSALSIPVDLKFESQDDVDRWNILTDGRIYWYYGGGYSADYNCIVGYSESSGTYDGTIISTPLKLEGGKTYRFTTDFYAGQSESLFNLKLTVGTDANSIKNATVMRNDEDMSYSDMYHREKLEDTFTAPADGTYYYGFYVKTEDQYNCFKLYGLNVELVSENDLKAVSIDNIKEAVVGKDNDLTVKVRNNGLKDQSKYAVKVYCDDEGNAELVGETTSVPAIKAGEYADVPLTIKPTKDGNFDFYAVVELEGDEDDSNNQTESIMLNVLPEGSASWTNVVTDGNETEDTHGAVLNYDPYERTQTVYLASEIKAKENAIIKRLAYVYSGNSLYDRTDPVNFKVYLAQTDKNEWTSSADWFTDDQLTLVYDGQNTYEPGTDNLLIFDLQTPFKYDNTKNLVVVVDKDGVTNPKWCASWKIFNASSSVKRMIDYGESGQFAGKGGYLRSNVPVLYLAIDYETSGIDNVVLGGNGVGYNNGAFTFGKDVKSANVYTVDGTLVATVASENAPVALKSGLYIVRTVLSNGKVESVKLNVK